MKLGEGILHEAIQERRDRLGKINDEIDFHQREITSAQQRRREVENEIAQLRLTLVTLQRPERILAGPGVVVPDGYYQMVGSDEAIYWVRPS